MKARQSRINRKRAEEMAALLENFSDGKLDWTATITDALCNLRHLCDRAGVSFEAADSRAAVHYETETRRPDDEERDVRAQERRRDRQKKETES